MKKSKLRKEIKKLRHKLEISHKEHDLMGEDLRTLVMEEAPFTEIDEFP